MTGQILLSCAMWLSPRNVEIVRISLHTGLVDVKQESFYWPDTTYLGYAAAVSRPELGRISVKEGGADLDDSNNDGNAPRGLYIDWRSLRYRK